MKRISLQPVHHILATKEMTVNQLLSQMTKTGVMGGGKLGRAADIYEMMLKDKECTKFFGLAGAMVPGGMKQIIIDMINDGWIDVLVTTGANLTHDLGEALGYRHYHSQEKISDAELHKQRLDRMFDSYMPDEIYEGLEDFFTKVLPKLPKERMGISRFLREIAPQIPTKHPSILRACYEKNIPIYCPALADSGIGLQIWNYIQRHNLDVLAFEDLKEMLDVAWTAKKAGIFYVGGGVPKNYIQQALQLSKGATYAIQITMDRPEPGGSSGAELQEGISWGKLKEDAHFVNLICDTTIALPLIRAAVMDRMK